MNWRASVSQDELNEIIADAHDAFQKTEIDESHYRNILGNCGLNAVDIEEAVQKNAPQP